MASSRELDVAGWDERQASPSHGAGQLVHIDFGLSGGSEAYRGHGWGRPERLGVWAVGPRSEIRLPAPSAPGDYILQILMQPYLCRPWCRGQSLHVLVKGENIGEAFIDQRFSVMARIDAKLLRVGEPIDIVLEHPGFAIPSALESSRDSRPLAVQVFSLWLWPEGLVRDAPSRPDLPSKALALAPAAPGGVQAEPGETPPIRSYSFGLSGSIGPYLGEGWHTSEKLITWTTSSAKIRIPVIRAAGPILLKLKVRPPGIGNVSIPQNFTIAANGEVLGQFIIAALHGYETVSVLVPDRVIDDEGFVALEFHLPDSVRPKAIGASRDGRLLGLCFERLEFEACPREIASVATGRYPAPPYQLSPARRSSAFLDSPREALIDEISMTLGLSVEDMLKRSESLGENCEFGIIQRKLNVEVLGLLRFGNAGLQNLIDALSDEFSEINNRDRFSFALNNGSPREYAMRLMGYDINWHTFVLEKDGLSEDEQTRQVARLAYLRRRFYDGLKTGRKLYILKDEKGRDIDRYLPVLVALNRYARNRLLVVGPATPDGPAGAVDLIGPGLMKGYVAKFAPNDAVQTADPDLWLPMLANAWTLAQADGLT